MEFIIFLWERTKNFNSTVYLIVISAIITFWVRAEINKVPNPHDVLAGTTKPILTGIMQGMWWLTLAFFVLYWARRLAKI